MSKEDLVPFNDLTPDDVEAIALCAEECGEAIQAAMKILRHGLETFDPGADHGRNNRDDLERELGQVLAAMDILWRQGLIRPEGIKRARNEKLRTVGNYLHHAVVGKKMPL